MREKVTDCLNLTEAAAHLQVVFYNQSFPREFRPPEDWVGNIEIQQPQIFEKQFADSVKKDKHPFSYNALKQADPNLENTLLKQAQSVRARVNLEDFQSRHIIVRKSDAFQKSATANIVPVLAQQCSYLVSPTIEEPISSEMLETLKDGMQEVRRQGHVCEEPDLRLRRQGCTQFITLEGKRLFMVSTLGKYYGTFFGELYADIYRVYTLTHLPMAHMNMSFGEALATLKNFLSSDSEADSMYYNKLLDYVEYSTKADWPKLIATGVRSDLDGFLAIGNETFGEKVNKNLLDELQFLRSKIALTFFS